MIQKDKKDATPADKRGFYCDLFFFSRKEQLLNRMCKQRCSPEHHVTGQVFIFLDGLELRIRDFEEVGAASCTTL